MIDAELVPDEVKEIVALLKTHHETFVSRWLGLVHMSKADPFYEEVKANGKQTIISLSEYLLNGTKESLEKLAKKAAKERIEAETNIGDFVYNINAGRNLIYQTILSSSLPETLKGNALLKVNTFFDELVYFSVVQYSLLKDDIIQKKNEFIQEMDHDRLTMLGQIAASFAHEFRNPLTSIKGFLDLLRMELPLTKKSSYYIEIMQNEMESLEEKVSQFLYLSKMKKLDDLLRPFDFSKTVEEMIDFMYPRFTDANIMMDSQIQSGIWIEGEPSQMKQVLLNILNNAVEELYSIDKKREIKVILTSDEHNCYLSISNNGAPIPDYLLDNIFQPFVTTKTLGTGLGLSVCKQIVEKHGGQIFVESSEKCTEFSIHLPVYSQ